MAIGRALGAGAEEDGTPSFRPFSDPSPIPAGESFDSRHDPLGLAPPFGHFDLATPPVGAFHARPAPAPGPRCPSAPAQPRVCPPFTRIVWPVM